MHAQSLLPTTSAGRHLYLVPANSPLAPQPVRRLLVANRGEIAYRIIRTCTQLGIETVAVYADADAEAPHVSAATQAVCLGSAVSANIDVTSPYMDADLLINTALETGCDALHPGYGYLSENADFADRVAATELPGTSGKLLRFVGPNGQVMREMGDKAASKQLLRRRMGDEAPIVPGYDGPEQGDSQLIEHGRKVGFPLIIKAAAGGGGRGMRIVYEEANLASEIARARSEALRNFNNATILLERYIAGGKHIEVQVFGDNYGDAVAFGERECSWQRRHQKIIEESPSPSFDGDEKLRQDLHAAAVKIVKLLSYSGAATCEFIFSAETREFFFLEINTRLQVEHPVTEMVFGIDFVSLQLYVAGGGKLQDLYEVQNAKPFGHAIECRICAEEPGEDFAPRTGLVRYLDFPLTAHHGARFDSGVTTASSVSLHFDAMLAKLIVHAPDRASCTAKMQSALRTTPILGVVTNTAFLAACLDHPRFVDGSYHTSLIAQDFDALLGRTPALARGALLATTMRNGASPVEIPVGAIVPAVLFFWQLRQGLNSSAASGMRPNWQLYRASSMMSTELYEVALPDGTGSYSIGVEYSVRTARQGGASEFDLAFWTNSGDDVEKTILGNLTTQLTSKAKKEGRPVPKELPLAQQRAGSVARYYSSVAQGGPQAGALLGSSKSSPIRLQAVLHSSTFARHSSIPTADEPLSSTWVSATLAMTIGGKRTTTVLASDDTFEQHESKSQGAFLWSPALSSQVKVTRSGLRVWATRAGAARSGAADESVYKTPMPCRILKILNVDGTAVQEGDAVLVIESMKTEVTVRARISGVVRIEYNEGDSVGEGQILFHVDTSGDVAAEEAIPAPAAPTGDDGVFPPQLAKSLPVPAPVLQVQTQASRPAERNPASLPMPVQTNKPRPVHRAPRPSSQHGNEMSAQRSVRAQ